MFIGDDWWINDGDIAIEEKGTAGWSGIAEGGEEATGVFGFQTAC